jgi:hypothetical protein
MDDILNVDASELSPSKGTSKLSVKLINMMKEENKREEREGVELPTLGPFGDKKFWDFKIFPKAYKGWQ